MTLPLRDLLGELADHEARISTLAAPDVRAEALHIRTQIRRLRTRRIAAVSVGAAAVLAVGIVTANAFTAPPEQLPVAPDQTVTSSPAPAPSPSETAEPSETPEPSLSPSPTATLRTPPATPPQAADLVHGAVVWGTYVAVVDSFDSPEADAAEARITELGYQPSEGDLGCDQGAAEALGLPENASVVSTYFATEQDAALFAQMYGPDALGIAEVKLFCMD
ncbi:hypothetical protein ASD16_09645 [Cellulomonas sp. Root485]|uniref:hypothetical protein n=1 Tax=Cellulomonas sp. Root485 TaxID=1736546 RepID=UPI0007013032|nr:hypothetical protein [Cellulomonas sp. Root485]KQY22867.1 hypothetical protein ASD16_09645 [Cellulomonas sp. Root485]